MLYCQIYCGISTPGNNIIKLKETNLTGVALDKKQTNKQTSSAIGTLFVVRQHYNIWTDLTEKTRNC